MTTLPPALARWSRELANFPPDLAHTLGSLVQRIALLIGAVERPPRPGGFDPDGVDGLDHRGSYERLLATEWALAQDFPDEFLRRAAMGELTFLRQAHRRPAGARTLDAVVDAGPDQIGAPRVAALAALIALARRANHDDAEFRWRIAQDDAEPALGLDAAAVASFLNARSHREPTAEDLRRCPDLAAQGERWLIGGPRLMRFASAGDLRLEITDPFDPAERALVVDLIRGHARLAGARLALADDGQLARLLRDPFNTRWRDPLRAPLGSTLVLFGSDTRLATATADSVTVEPLVPQGARQTLRVGGATPIAVYRHRKETHLIARGADGRVHDVAHRQARVTTHRELQACAELTAPSAEARRLGLAVPTPILSSAKTGEPISSVSLLFSDGAGSLFGVRAGTKRVELVARDLLAIASGEHHGAFVATLVGADTPSLITVTRQEYAVRQLPLCARAWLGFSHGGATCQCSIERSDGTIVVDVFGRAAHMRSLGGIVLGMGAPSRKAGGALGLLLLDPDRQSFSIAGIATTRKIHRTASPVVAAVAGAVARFIAFQTDDGEVRVLDYRRCRLVLPAPIRPQRGSR